MLTYFDLLNLYNHQKFLQSLLNYYIDINSPIFYLLFMYCIPIIICTQKL